MSLEKVQERGETLNQIIASIITILEVDAIALNRFKSKLYEAGYFDQYFALYDSGGYLSGMILFILLGMNFHESRKMKFVVA